MIKNIILWNCRGTGKRNFVNKVLMVLGNLRPNALVLMETRVLSHKGKPILTASGYDKWDLVEGNGYVGVFGWLGKVQL